MRNFLLTSLAVAVLILASAFSLHKFYVAIYQVNFASDKKMVQITSRVFIDDLNEAINKKYRTRTNLGEKNENSADVLLMQKYFAENFTVRINGTPKQLEFMSHEMDNNVVVGYFRITGVSRISELEVTGKILFDHVTDQQNIIQTNINGKKETQLLTVDDSVAEFNY